MFFTVLQRRKPSFRSLNKIEGAFYVLALEFVEDITY
jgi:hypothetical protein